MQSDTWPDEAKPPSPAELEAAAYAALCLPRDEESAQHGLAHFLGTLSIEHNDAAFDAVVKLWTERFRAALYVKRRRAPPDWYTRAADYTLPPAQAKCNVLRFHEYLDEVRNLNRAHPAPRAHASYKPYASNVQGRFAASFNARRYTPDRRGYRSYLDDHAPEKLKRALRKRLPVCLPEEDRRLNSYVFASPGSGKSELLKLLVHAEVRRKRPTSAVIVIDIAGDLARQMRFREFAEDDSRLVYIDPSMDLRHAPCLNPFEVQGTFSDIYAERDAKDKQADQIFNALVQALRDAPEGGTITPQMVGVLKPSIRALLDIPRATFMHLERLMVGDPVLVGQCQRSTDENAADFFQRLFLLESYNPSRIGIASRLRATFLAETKFIELTCGQNTFPFEQLIEQRKIIVFNLAEGAVTTSAALAFGRFILATISAIGYRRTSIEDERKRTITHVIIDEFQNFVTESVFQAIEKLRKYNIRYTLVQPTLFSEMTTKQRHILQTGVQGAHFFGKCGQKSTAEFAASFFGGIEPDELVELTEAKGREGEFFVRTHGRPTVLLLTDDRLLKGRHTLSDAEWEPLKRRQLETYYRRKESERTWQHKPSSDAPGEPEAEPRAAPKGGPEQHGSAQERPKAAPKDKAKPKAKRSRFEGKRPPRDPPPREPR